MPNSRLNITIEACDRCTAALATSLVVDFPGRGLSIVLPFISANGSQRETVGLHTFGRRPAPECESRIRTWLILP